MKEKNNRDRMVQVRLLSTEMELLKKGFAATTKQKFSEYVRCLLLSKPVVAKVRNSSIDDFVTVLAAMRMELKAAGNNLNQAVRKLHTLNAIRDIERWLEIWERDKIRFQKCVDSITAHMDKINDEWLR